MTSHRIVTATVASGAAQRAAQVEAQVPGEACVPEPAVVYPAEALERVGPSGEPVLAIGCEGEGPFGLPEPLPGLGLPPVAPLPLADPSGADLSLEFVS